MTRYLAFFGSKYYPCAGLGDCVGKFDELNEAIGAVQKAGAEESPGWRWYWGQVWDTETMKIVWTDQEEQAAP